MIYSACMILATVFPFVATWSTPHSHRLFARGECTTFDDAFRKCKVTPFSSCNTAVFLQSNKRCQDAHGVPSNSNAPIDSSSVPKVLPTSLLCALVCFASFSFDSSLAAAAADEASADAVESAIQALRSASGSAQKTFEAYENVAAIITEGKGVGGSINYKGVQLERGYVADEDTSIYNPGLTLMTESEKLNLVEAVIQSRRECINTDWNDDNQLAYEFLREKLDPLHMVELRGYLSIFPFYVAAVYAAVLAVQQLVRGLFPVAYFVGVLAIVGPALALVALGPQ